MKKRSQERPVEQSPKTQVAPEQAPTAPAAPMVETGLAPVAPPPVIKTCGICERPLPCPKHDRPVDALAGLQDGAPVLNALIEDAPDVQEQEKFDIPPPRTLAELHDRIREHRQPKPEYVPPPRTERQQAQLEAEMAAGRRATERATAQQAVRPQPVRDRTEGTNTPVYRPGDVDEYRGTFKQQAQTPSKDAR